jgi:hypothetical protein
MCIGGMRGITVREERRIEREEKRRSFLLFSFVLSLQTLTFLLLFLLLPPSKLRQGLLWETSLLDPEEGIRFRGYSIPECQVRGREKSLFSRCLCSFVLLSSSSPLPSLRSLFPFFLSY